MFVARTLTCSFKSTQVLVLILYTGACERPMSPSCSLAIQGGSARHLGTSLEIKRVFHYIYSCPLTASLLPCSLPRFHAGWCAGERMVSLGIILIDCEIAHPQ